MELLGAVLLLISAWMAAETICRMVTESREIRPHNSRKRALSKKRKKEQKKG